MVHADNGATLRALDILWFGMAMGIGDPSFLSLSCNFLLCSGILATCLLVLPYMGYAYVRPIPFALLGCLLTMLLSQVDVTPACTFD